MAGFHLDGPHKAASVFWAFDSNETDQTTQFAWAAAGNGGSIGSNVSHPSVAPASLLATAPLGIDRLAGEQAASSTNADLAPALSMAGVWTPVPTSFLSANNSGGVNPYSTLVPMGSDGDYGFAMIGWGGDPAAARPDQVDVGLFVPNGSGGETLDTGSYISNPVTNGAQSALAADFNGDGKTDLVFVPYNEWPWVPEPPVAFMSNADGSYTRVRMPGSVIAHDAEIAYVGNKPVVVTTGGSNGSDVCPTYTYANGKWTEHLSSTFGDGLGGSVALAPFAGSSGYEMVRGDVGFDWNGSGYDAIDIAVYGFDTKKYALTDSADNPIQRITPYLSTLPQYQSYQSINGVGKSHVYRVWTDDVNHDGHPDILAGESMWNKSSDDFPDALQVLINKGDGTFKDETAKLNPSMSLNTEELGYNPDFVDIDHSGIKTYFFSFLGGDDARQSNFLILNDGTGHLYVGLHSQFVQLNSQVVSYLQAQYPDYVTDTSAFSQFIAVPQKDGSVNYVAEHIIGHWYDSTNGIWQNEFAFVNLPIHYNPATDFKRNVTITDRNGSMLIRTWAGNDTIGDANSGPSCHIDGGLGANTCLYSGSWRDYAVGQNGDGSFHVGSLPGKGVPHVSDTLVDIQKLQFGGAVALLGDASANTLSGTSGRDLLFGAAGNDILHGAAGNDVLDGNKGNDLLDGGPGNDTASYADATGGVKVSLLITGPQNTGAAGHDTLESIENIEGSNFNDTLIGDNGANILTGGLGADHLIGGEGDDSFVYSSAAESTGSGYDTITGFDFKNADSFDLWFAVSGISAAVDHGELRSAHFDADLAAAIGTHQLGKFHAVLFTPNSGTLKGDTFIIIDANGKAGYQAGEDLVIRLDAPKNPGSLGLGDFHVG